MRTPLALTALLAASVLGLCHYAPPRPPASITVRAYTPQEMTNWIHSEQMAKKYAIAERIATRIYANHGCHDTDLIFFTARKAVDHGLPVSVLSALVVVESSCRRNARSDRAACGYMQINTKIWHVSCEKLSDPETNIEIGSRILAEYRVRFGGLRDGLHHYLGMGSDDGQIDGEDYADRVLTTAGYKVN